MPFPKLARDTLVKTAAEVKRYTMDFSNELEDGETISGVATWAISPLLGGPVASGKANSSDGKMAQATLTGGTNGVTYTVTVTIGTSTGETLVGQGYLIVED